MHKLYNDKAFSIADAYCTLAGIKSGNLAGYFPPFYPVNLTDEHGIRIADAFDTAEAQEQGTPQVLADYAEFKSELLAQWKFFLAVAGIDVIPWIQDGQPYANSAELIVDVKDNNRMYFFRTIDGFGEAHLGVGDRQGDKITHPLLEDTGYTVHGHALLYNDLFRIIHDYFGHCIWGHTFGPQGETQAWLSHLAMFKSPAARRVLSVETQGQTAWFNYGKHLRRPDNTIPHKGDADFTPLADRPYANQTIMILPDEVWEPIATI